MPVLSQFAASQSRTICLSKLAIRSDGVEPVWIAADPTNRGLTGERHVKIGHGRHYSDVPPVRGVYRGHATADLHATVRMTRTDTAPRAAPAAG